VAEAPTLRELLDRQAQERPASVALLFPDGEWLGSYAALRQRAAEIAARLTGAGLRPGDRAATILENGAGAVFAFLGAQYGGFVATPLDPAASDAELRATLEHSGARAVFLPADRSDRLAGARQGEPTIVEVDETGNCAWTGPPASALYPLQASDAAVLDYTSGSSGRPKGVVVTHRNVLASARIHRRAQEMTAADRALLVLPLHHMNAQHVTLLSSLVSGASVVVPRRFVPSEFWGHADRYGCTWFAAVPTVLVQLLQLAPSEAERSALRKLRFARCSAAPLPRETLRRCEERFGIPIVEAMGMTESGGTFFFNPLPPGQRKPGSVGRPVVYEARVVDAQGHECAAGQAGEILVRGEPLMRGYHRDPEATAAALTQDGWLRTGDVGHRDEDGYFFVSGRAKEIIIKGGQNIAPAEVERVLAAHPEVVRAAVVGVSDPVFGEDVVGCVVARAPADGLEGALLAWCRERLGVWKAPARIVFLPELPTSATGKVLRAELARMAAGAAAAPPGRISPAEAASVEAELAAIWEDVLGVPVGPHDNFFDLGGYSLPALEMSLRIERRFGRLLPVSLLFECPTIASLAAVLSQRVQLGAWSPIVPIRPSGSKPPVFGLYAEDHVLFYYRLAHAMDADRPFYGIQSLTLAPQAQLPERLEELAARYVVALKRVQPHGPYHLAGHCSGAVLSFEMAQQLVAGGDQVAFLGILDSGAPRIRPLALSQLRQDLPRSLGRYARSALQQLRAGGLRSLARRVRDEVVRPLLLERFLAATRAGMPSLDITRLTAAQRDARLKRLREAWETPYVARPYPGRLTHISSANYAAIPSKQPRVERWSELAQGGTDRFVTPGTHFSMFRHPEVMSLARLLDRCLEDAERA